MLHLRKRRDLKLISHKYIHIVHVDAIPTHLEDRFPNMDTGIMGPFSVFDPPKHQMRKQKTFSFMVMTILIFQLATSTKQLTNKRMDWVQGNAC